MDTALDEVWLVEETYTTEDDDDVEVEVTEELVLEEVNVNSVVAWVELELELRLESELEVELEIELEVELDVELDVELELELELELVVEPLPWAACAASLA